MKVVSIVLGIALVALGFACIFTPFSAFLATGYLICICLLVFGAIGLIRMLLTKTVRPLMLIVDILGIVFGIIALCNPGAVLVFDMIVVYLMAIWFLVYGVFNLIESIRMRREVNGWGFGVAIGILGIIVGLLAISYPVFAMVASGIMIGLGFIDAGFGMLTYGTLFAGFGGNGGNGGKEEK